MLCCIAKRRIIVKILVVSFDEHLRFDFFSLIALVESLSFWNERRGTPLHRYRALRSRRPHLREGKRKPRGRNAAVKLNRLQLKLKNIFFLAFAAPFFSVVLRRNGCLRLLTEETWNPASKKDKKNTSVLQLPSPTLQQRKHIVLEAVF